LPETIWTYIYMGLGIYSGGNLLGMGNYKIAKHYQTKTTKMRITIIITAFVAVVIATPVTVPNGEMSREKLSLRLKLEV